MLFCLPRYIQNIPVYAFNGIQNSKSYYFFRKNVMTGEVVTVLDRYSPTVFYGGHSLTTREANKLASDVARRKPTDPKSKGKK